MRVTLMCVGRLKASAERDLAFRYLERAKAAGRSVGLTIDLHELEESRARRPEDRKAEEARAILTWAGAGRMIAFDEAGQPLDSVGFAAHVGTARDEGAASLSLVIGGPDGLDAQVRQRAARVIAFGTMTWPHQLVRIMASEQIYRAVTILGGHPYHRA